MVTFFPKYKETTGNAEDPSTNINFNPSMDKSSHAQ